MARTYGADGSLSTSLGKDESMASETITLHLPTMHCGGCTNTARGALERAGAEVEATDIHTNRLTVTFDTESLSREDLEAAMEAVGFPPASD